MNNYAKLEVYIDDNVVFYTVRRYIDNKPDPFTETQKFFNTLKTLGKTPESDIMTALLKTLSRVRVRKEMVRHESRVDAFLPYGKQLRQIFPTMSLDKFDKVRLYLYRLNDYDVVLMNGGIKSTDLAVSNCKDVYPHFLFANKIGRLLDKQISNGDIDASHFYHCHQDIELPI